ncbi:MAG: MBL fold metallo-hydrolase [Candidatus Hodarchaeota archaeon]
MGHPYQENYCGYIVTVNGIRIFHSGDTGNIPEFQDLEGKIDVLILAMGSSYATMTFEDAIDAIGEIQPKYLIPTHYLTMDIRNFITECTETYPDIEICTDELVLTVDNDATEKGGVPEYAVFLIAVFMIVAACVAATSIIYYRKFNK